MAAPDAAVEEEHAARWPRHMHRTGVVGGDALLVAPGLLGDSVRQVRAGDLPMIHALVGREGGREKGIRG